MFYYFIIIFYLSFTIANYADIVKAGKIKFLIFFSVRLVRCNIWVKSNHHPLTHLNTYVVLYICIHQKRFPIDRGIDSKETRRGEFWREPLKRKHVKTWSNKLDSYNVDFLDSLNKSFQSWKVHYRCDAKLISLKFRVEVESAESVKSLKVVLVRSLILFQQIFCTARLPH